MTYRMALKTVRSHARKNDGLEKTFKIICANRECNQIRKWAIYDLARSKNKTKIMAQSDAKRLYYRHLTRLMEIFRDTQVGY